MDVPTANTSLSAQKRVFRIPFPFTHSFPPPSPHARRTSFTLFFFPFTQAGLSHREKIYRRLACQIPSLHNTFPPMHNPSSATPKKKKKSQRSTIKREPISSCPLPSPTQSACERPHKVNPRQDRYQPKCPSISALFCFALSKESRFGVLARMVYTAKSTCPGAVRWLS